MAGLQALWKTRKHMDKGRTLMVKSNPLMVVKWMPNTEGWSGGGKKGAPSPRPGAYPESGLL